MIQVLVVAIAGALGAVSRYALVNVIGAKSFPYGTLCVNILGSLLMGVAYVVIVEKGLISDEFKPFIMTGFLGAFTTFSTFSLDTWLLIEKGDVLHALTYILSSVILCVLSLIIGIFLSKYAFSYI